MANATVQNLTDSSAQALQALINSLSFEAKEFGEKPTIDQVRKLSNKLSQLVGQDGLDALVEMRNDKGELLNEEGLPIIDISEPLQDVGITSISELHPIADPELVPLKSLPKDEAERLRRERDRILDILEAEEMREEETVEQREREERREALERRKNDPKFELERLRAAKEMQKAGEREEKEKTRILALDNESQEKKVLESKKSVSFADLPTVEDDEQTQDKAGASAVQRDWGDVSPARLRATKRPMLSTKAEIDNHPMKMYVIERLPPGTPTAQETIMELGDSDDETIPESPVPADSDDGHIIQLEPDHGDEPHPLEAPSSESDGNEEPEDESIVEDECDLDMARHQREIALEYYGKRGTIGGEVSEAMRSDAHGEVEDDWDQEEVPLEAILSSPHPKPLISKFKASRIASSYNTSAPSTSYVLPASSSRTLRHAIRTGRLENDQLVAPAQSDTDDEDESMKEVLELLKKGDVQNIGPEHHPLSSSPPTSPVLPNLAKRTSSKFKLTRPQRQPSPSSPASGSQTPVSNTRRSSPKLPSSPAVDSRSAFPREPHLSSPQTPMIIDSPSFRPYPTTTPGAPSPSFPPSFHKPTVVAPPPFQSMPSRGPTRPDRPPTVMSSTVREMTQRGTGNGETELPGVHESNSSDKKKVSRFLAERM